MIVKPCEFLKGVPCFKHWGKVFTSKDFDETQPPNGRAIRGGSRFVQWEDSVSINAGEFLIVAAERADRRHGDKGSMYDYVLVRGGDDNAQVAYSYIKNETSRVIETCSEEWKTYLKSMDKTFPAEVVAKTMHSVTYRMGLFVVWLAIQAEGGLEPEPQVDLSKVNDAPMISELRSRGWIVQSRAEFDALCPVPMIMPLHDRSSKWSKDDLERGVRPGDQ